MKSPNLETIEAGIDMLTSEIARLATENKRLTAENEGLKRGIECYTIELADDVRKIEELNAERDALKSTCERAKGCIMVLLNGTPVRDVDETLAEIDAAISKEKT